MTIVLFIALILLSLVLVVAVLMQQGQRQGLGAISGGAETFFGKGKAKSLDAKLQKITKIAAIAFIVLAIATTMVVSHIADDSADVELTDVAAEIAEIVDAPETEAATDAEAVEAPAEETEAAPAE